MKPEPWPIGGESPQWKLGTPPPPSKRALPQLRSCTQVAPAAEVSSAHSQWLAPLIHELPDWTLGIVTFQKGHSESSPCPYFPTCKNF